MAGVKGAPRVYYKKFKFIIEIDGFQSAKFQKCSKLEAKMAVVEQREGGTLIPDKSLGLASFSDVTLTRGATSDLDVYKWWKLCLDVSAGTGALDDEYKKDFDVVVQNRDNKPLVRWRVTKAFPTGFSPGEWDNDANENLAEEVVLSYDYFDVIPV